MYFHWCRGRVQERLGRKAGIRFRSGVESEDWGLRDWGEESAPGESRADCTRVKEADRVGSETEETQVITDSQFQKHFLISGPLYTQKLLKTPRIFLCISYINICYMRN